MFPASPTGVISPHKKSPTSTVVVPSSPAKAPETDPIDVAAHLQLLGESLSHWTQTAGNRGESVASKVPVMSCNLHNALREMIILFS